MDINPVIKALWFIESHFASEITLDEIANVAGVSRYHMTRAFGDTTGRSVMRYVRGRRLTEAARVLAGGATDILAVAIEAAYGSHEAFTRAFREQFGVTPETVRRQGDLGALELVEPIKMEEMVRASIPPVRFERGKVLLIAGIAQRYTCETSAGIPSQWQRFLPHIGNIAEQVGTAAFGVRWFRSLADVSELIRAHQISPVELVTACLDRIECLQPQLNAFISVPRESALQAAKTAERDIQRGEWKGVLHGIPVGISTKRRSNSAAARLTGSPRRRALSGPTRSRSIATP